MRITTFGTRGSLPVAGPGHSKYGGNTTCLRVESDSLPKGLVLAIDAGTGFLPLSREALAEGMERLVVLHTHYHHDHTQGALIAPPIYIPTLPISFIGPKERGIGPRQVYELIMGSTLHPVEFGAVAHHLKFGGIETPSTEMMVVHPRGGFKRLTVELYERYAASGKHLPFEDGKDFPADECLTIRMHYSLHPERTIAYRFTEPGGKSFVFLTDEEVRSALPASLRAFLKDANLLIGDAQYTEETYRTRTAGFGHGTPEYVVSLAKECGVSRLGLTHHDPQSDDAAIDEIEQLGKEAAAGSDIEVFACKDFDRHDL